MKITVVVTTYNRYEYAKRAINSVILQTRQPDEIIVVEDGSESGIKDWLNKNYSKSIKYINNKINRGLAFSRNIGIKLTQYEWIAFLDDDDEWLKDRLEAQEKLINSLSDFEIRKICCITSGVITVDSRGNTKGISFPKISGDLKTSIINFGLHTPSSTFLFQKNLLISVGGFSSDIISGIDHDVFMKMAVAGYIVKYVEKPLVRIFQEPKESMMTNVDKRIIGIRQYIDKWTPTYINWFGNTNGNLYAKKYYAKVISRLAGEKLAAGNIKDFIKVIKSITIYSRFNPEILYYSCIKIIKRCLSIRLAYCHKERFKKYFS